MGSSRHPSPHGRVARTRHSLLSTMSRPTERTALLADVALSPSVSPSASRRSRKPSRLSLLVIAVGTLLLSLVLVVRRREPGVVVSIQDDWEYDAIVVGGGPAGSVVAKLLSDDPWRRVLLIEAGSATQAELGGTQRIPSQLNANNLTPFDVPFHWSSVANTQVYHWDYPDVNVAKALGGCGIHNAMLYVRALPSDFHRWDMSKWTWQKALEIYLHMEDFDGPESEYHGKNGTVRTSPPSFIDELSYEFVAASEQVGIPRSPDFNAPNGRFGVGFYHFNTRHGVRESAARRFLGPILQAKRENFDLLLNSTVQKIVLNEAATKAEGVEIERLDGTRQTIRLAKRGQVIVTGGAINTPKILMMSGLGHSGDLKALKIPVKRHLPRVGMNLQDHPVLAMAFSTPMPREIDLHAELTSYFEATQEKHVNVTSYGMMGSAGISAGAFLIPPGKTIPEIQLTFFPRKSEPHVWNSSELNHSAEILFTVALLHPKARNRVILTTENNVDYLPRIVSEVPEQEEEHLRDSDVWKLSWGITVVREIAAVLAQKGVLARELTPGPQIRAMEDLNAWVRNNVFRNSHWVGSASMGPSPDKAVVDSHLRVFGIPNLRVADASVIPYIPNGNVHSSVLMVATHAAELIKEDEQDHE